MIFKIITLFKELQVFPQALGTIKLHKLQKEVIFSAEFYLQKN